MKTFWIEHEMKYDGTQLKSLFAYMNYRVQGDSIVSWIGPCDIPNEHIVDGEDLLAGEKICGAKMLHFIVEKFHISLFTAVTLQRLLSAIAMDLVRQKSSTKTVIREGDDIFVDDGKLSISIATLSPVSGLIHFAINISNEGTPVKTASLGDLGIDPIAFSKTLMSKFTEELSGIENATTKVRPVR